MVFCICLIEEITDEVNENEEPSLAQGHLGKSKFLCNDKRRAIYDMLWRKSIDGKLKKGITGIVASQFLVSIHIVQRIWR